MDIDWKNLHIDGVSKIEKLIGEYSIYTHAVFHFIRFRIYERQNGQFYCVAGITVKTADTDEFIRPYGEGDITYRALANAICHLYDLVINLNAELDNPAESNYILSESHEY